MAKSYAHTCTRQVLPRMSPSVMPPTANETQGHLAPCWLIYRLPMNQAHVEPAVTVQVDHHVATKGYLLNELARVVATLVS